MFRYCFLLFSVAMHDDDTIPIMVARWWEARLQGIGVSWLQDTSYNQLNHGLICAFVERWHKETSSFHLPFGEMTVTLDDVSCLLHIPIDGMLLSHSTITRDEAVDMMVEHLGSNPRDALFEVNQTKGAHCQFSYLRKIFKERMFEQLELETEYGVTQEVQRLQDQAVRIYLLYLVGITLFTDKSATAVDVVYLRYFRDLDIVAGYSWGATRLSHLYRELSKAALWNCGQVSGYLTLLQV